MIKTKVLLIEDDGPPQLIDSVRCLGQEKSVEIYIASLRKNSRMDIVKYSRYVKNHFPLKGQSDQDKINQIMALCKKLNINIILPTKEPTYKLFSKFISELNGFNLPPIGDSDTLRIVTDKWLLHQWLTANELPSPQSYEARVENLEKLCYPFIIKPRRNAGGNDISLIQDSKTAMQKINDPNFTPEEFFFQEVIPGDILGFSMIAQNGKILTYTIHTGLKKTKFTFPKEIQFMEKPELLQQAQELIKKLNWSGIANFDFVHSKKSNLYYLLDVNPRAWSTMMGALNAGTNFPLHLLQLALGKEVAFNGYQKNQFYLNKIAVKRILTDIFKKGKLPSLRNTSLYYGSKDPLPEVAKGFQFISDKIFN